MKQYRNETKCSKCNGAGLVRCNDQSTWNVTLCKECNGFGIVLLVNKKPVAYTSMATYKRRLNAS